MKTKTPNPLNKFDYEKIFLNTFQNPISPQEQAIWFRYIRGCLACVEQELYLSKKSFDPHSKEVFSISRTAVEDFVKCKRCFYLNIRTGIAKYKGLPFTLNNAVDALLKKEFDHHRKNKTKHPIFEQYQIEAIPYDHPDIEDWRNKNDGLNRLHPQTQFKVCGKLDDVWVTPKNELIVADYKATASETPVTFDSPYRQQYKRQLDIYAWILKGMGFNIHSKAYLVYANASKAPAAFNNQLQFTTTLLEHTIDDSWIEGTLVEIRQCLEAEGVPDAPPDCPLCTYVRAVSKVS